MDHYGAVHHRGIPIQVAYTAYLCSRLLSRKGSVFIFAIYNAIDCGLQHHVCNKASLLQLLRNIVRKKSIIICVGGSILRENPPTNFYGAVEPLHFLLVG